MTMSEIEALVRRGESDSVEFKKSTGQLTRAAETLCAFLNGHGGLVVVGVSPDKKITGKILADGTLRDIAQCFNRFEPPARIQIHRVPLPDSDRGWSYSRQTPPTKPAHSLSTGAPMNGSGRQRR